MKSLALKLSVFALGFFVFFPLKAQSQKPLSPIEDIFVNHYRQPREKILVHVNKTVFLPGESIWFQAHVLDPRFDHPSPISANVYAGLYDAEGQLITGDVFYAEDGLTAGQLTLDKNLKDKSYIFAVFTQWALNFGREQLYAQVINIAESDYRPIKNFNSDDYYITLNTEGHTPLIINTLNRIVYSLTNPDGQAVSFTKGELLDSQQKVINIFAGNETGLGEFQFWPQENQHYQARFYFDDNRFITQDLPALTDRGLKIQVNILTENRINIALENILPTADKTFVLALAKDGYLFKKDLRFIDGKAQFTLNKNDLPHGINTVFVLQDNTVLAQRSFLNRPEEYLPEARLQLIKATRDSIYLSVQTFSDEKFTFSASVLPADSEADIENLSFLKQNFLNPYGGVENRKINHKLIDGNRIDNYAFDLFLQTRPKLAETWSGWLDGQYSAEYDFEKGLTLSGKVEISTKQAQKKKLILFTDDLSFQQKLDLSENGSFTSYHNYLEKGQLLKVALANKGNFLQKPELESFSINPNTENRLAEFPFAETFANELYEEIQFSGQKLALQMSDIPDLIALEETQVQVDSKEAKEKIPGYIGSSVDTKRYNIDADEVKLNFYLFDFLRTKGYWVTLNNTPGTPSIRSMQSGGGTPTIFLNNVQIVDFSILTRLPLYEVEEIFINRSGLGYGVRGGSTLGSSGGGVIHIFLRVGASFTGFSGNYENNETLKVENGYQKTLPYKAPEYKVFDNNTFARLGVLTWLHSLKTNTKGELYFTVPRMEQNQIKVRLEGLSPAGNIVTLTETLNLDDF